MKLNWKKSISLLLCILLMTSLAACGKKGPADLDDSSATKGQSYVGVGKGHNGDVKVEVSFDDGKIVAVKVIEHEETEGVGTLAIERLPDEIKERQSLAVDSVSGATMTSEAILMGVEDAIKQAGLDVDTFKTASGAEGGQKEDIIITTDVLVVGAGGTGLAAAASAHENGAEVIVLEKLAITGGSTALSGGAIGATGTRFQKELGIEDSKDSWMKLWKERQAIGKKDAKYPDYDRVDKFMDEAVITTHWLVDNFNHKYPAVIGYGFDPAERLHFPEKSGADITNVIEKYLNSKGIEVMKETPATELITDSNGDVIGVIAEGKDGRVTINAKKVILATGGFARNEELLERLVPEMAGSSELSAASAGSTGDGILMAEKVGAVLYEEPWVIGLSIASHIPGLAGLEWDASKIYINEDGQRFMNEASHYAIVTNAVAEQDKVWVVFDSGQANGELIGKLKDQMDHEEVFVGESIEELAKAMGVPEDKLVKTIKDFNEGILAGSDNFAKPDQLLVSVEEGPFYALRYYPKTMGTFGGVKTNENYQVLREDGSVINNLYAGGEVSNKVYYNQVYMTGSSVQIALTSGRIAGEHAAKAIK